MSKFKLKECHLFKNINNHDICEFGQIVEIIIQKGIPYYKMHIVSNEFTDNYIIVSEPNIVVQEPNANSCINQTSTWIQQHIDAVNLVFGYNVSSYVLADYDSVKEVEEDWGKDFIADCNPQYLKEVNNRYVLLIG